jgi:hypothetical protein
MRRDDLEHYEARACRAQSNTLASLTGHFDLYVAISIKRIVARIRGAMQSQTQHFSSNRFANRPDHMAIRSEFSAWVFLL